MAELKTKKNDADVLTFINNVENKRRKADSLVLLQLLQDITGEAPSMWGPTIIGFGSYDYKYESGRKGNWFLTGFSPRKASLSLYMMGDALKTMEILSRLGKHKKSKGCLYINKLADVDMTVLEELIRHSVQHLNNKSC